MLEAQNSKNLNGIHRKQSYLKLSHATTNFDFTNTRIGEMKIADLGRDHLQGAESSGSSSWQSPGPPWSPPPIVRKNTYRFEKCDSDTVRGTSTCAVGWLPASSVVKRRIEWTYQEHLADENDVYTAKISDEQQGRYLQLFEETTDQMASASGFIHLSPTTTGEQHAPRSSDGI
ncbi:hypothetical protein D9613_009470 [Agrocybe pediades]|uniref:Uncharacterized protein n=1 Tax=Agrocybe pediades TaxID=84607 RepID=A0A8H4R3A0_9AGAR|nr:hypothetical protein D9613_009470 [Agrocybe pediades]